MIKEFDKPTLKSLRPDINAALQSVAEKYGIAIDCGNASFTPNSATFKLNLSVKDSSGNAITPEAERFDAFAEQLGLKKEHRGREVVVKGKKCIIHGLKSDISCAFPVIVHLANGRVASITLDFAKRLLNPTPPA